MPTQNTFIVDNKYIVPAVPCESVQIPFNMAISSTIQRGTVVGVVTSTANEVQTLAKTGTVNGGTYTVSITYNGVTQTTTALAHSANAATLQAALRLLSIIGNSVVVTGGDLPTTAFTLTFSGVPWTGAPVPLLVSSSASLTGGGTYDVTRTTEGRTANTIKAYASGNSDGTQNPIGIMVRTATTDSHGNVTLAPSGQTDPWGRTAYPAVSVWTKGLFYAGDLVGLDATAMTNGKWRRVSGGAITEVGAIISIG